MHYFVKKMITAWVAALLCIVMLAVPASAIITDINEDGIVDVFDRLITIRNQLSTPLNLSISSAEGCPGEEVVLCVSIDQNPGFDSARIVLNYDKGLQVLQPDYDDIDEEMLMVRQNMFFSPFRDTGKTVVLSQTKEYTEENGEILYVRFRIPQDAVPDTVYTIHFEDTQLYQNKNVLPMLTARGSITVLHSEDEPPITTTTTTAPATAVTTVTTTGDPLLTDTAATVSETTLTTSAPAQFPETTTVTVTTELTSETTTVTKSSIRGIDISAWQGDVDFNAIKNESDTQFIIVRAGFGKYLKQEDKYFKTYYNGAKSVGIPVGAYWYSYATTPEDARIEANVCAQVLGDRKFEYPIAFDIEEPRALDQGMEKVSAIIEAFCSEMEKKGYFAQIYCSSFYLKNTISESTRNRYDVWVANYNVSKPSYTGNYGIWQYGYGTCAGVKGDCDMDIGYRDYPTLIQQRHCNGY